MNELGLLLERLLQQRKERGVRNPYVFTTEDGGNVTASMLRLRFDGARKSATEHALENQDKILAEQIWLFQFRDIRPKAASEILIWRTRVACSVIPTRESQRRCIVGLERSSSRHDEADDAFPNESVTIQASASTLTPTRWLGK